MKKTRFSIFLQHLRNCILAVLTVFATTVPLFLIGRVTLGEAVIALVYLLPVAWSANRWGQLAGTSAALTAAMCFDFLFIPPFFTFVVGRLEGWLVLAIFLAVAIYVVERIQSSLSQARDATFMYELSSILANQRTPEAVAYAISRQVQQLFQACQVNVIFQPDKVSPAVVSSAPDDCSSSGKPDRILPIISSWGYVGEIQIWHGPSIIELPALENRLMQNFSMQAARAFERTHPFEADNGSSKVFTNASTK